MASLTCSRSDLFPPSTTVSVRPFGSKQDGGPPRGAELASGTVDANGALSVSHASILPGTRYWLYANAGGHKYVLARSTADGFDDGGAVGTADTTNGSATVANAAASSGSFRAGQRITGPGIPAGTRIHSVSGSTLTLTAAATATATGVTVRCDGAFTWSARVRQRRAALATS